MVLPEKLITSLAGVPGFDRDAFVGVHQSGERVTSIRINPAKPVHDFPRFQIQPSDKVPWTDFGYYLERRPSFTFDPLFHAGCYYVQEASSMFLEHALKNTVDLARPITILDLAAAPGGKSTHLQSIISADSLLVSNEVIRSRSHVLRDNMVKWGGTNVVVTSDDPRNFLRLENHFDVVVVDAPCSGSGLFRRDEDATGEWSEQNVQLCGQRQRRILADIWPSLKPNGILIYATCSYSKEEDEDNIEWLKKEFQADPCKLSPDPDWNIVESAGGYRFWPYLLGGEGFFLACLRKQDGADSNNKSKKGEFEPLTKKEAAIANSWVDNKSHSLVKNGLTVYALPDHLMRDLAVLSNHLHPLYSGTVIGNLVGDKLIPAHSLAMSTLVSASVDRLELSDEQSIQYLQKKEMTGLALSKGWRLVTFRGQSLGWVNVLPGRINNYYPKELRILKDL